MTSLKNHISRAPGDSLLCWFQGKFCDFVSFELLVERIFLV